VDQLCFPSSSYTYSPSLDKALHSTFLEFKLELEANLLAKQKYELPSANLLHT